MKIWYLSVLCIVIALTIIAQTFARQDHTLRTPTSGVTIRVSISSDGSEANSSSSSHGTFSADGRYVTFVSNANNLVNNDTNNFVDVFIHDLQTGQTQLISVASDGTQGNSHVDGSYFPQSISADGKYVAFSSLASNLVNNDSNDVSDIFVRDWQTGLTTRVSVAYNGAQGNAYSGCPDISSDGRFVVFMSFATNLVNEDLNNRGDIFRHDRQTGQTLLISVASNGAQGNDSSFCPSISGDGRYIIFSSFASNFVSGDTNGKVDVFVHDIQTGQTTRVSVASDGTQGNDDSGHPYIAASPLSISTDGRYVSFISVATNLVNNDTNNNGDAFIHDNLTETTTRVSVGTGGIQGNYGGSDPVFSDDGRYVAFSSESNNFVEGDTNNRVDIFVLDQQTGVTTRISTSSDGIQGNEHSIWPFISFDGRYLGFNSNATNLVPGDTNNTWDIFVHDRGSEAPKPVVVLVHGWHGTIFHTTDTCESIAEHATYINNIPANDFGVFARNLMLDGWDVWIAHVATGPAGTPRIQDNATCLKHQLENIPAPNGIVLIAHSMGGLISRAYIESEEYKDGNVEVNRLITLGTPHTGTSYGAIFCLNPFDDAACQFTPLGMLFFNSTYSRRADRVEYDLIGGDKTPGLAGRFLATTDGWNDGIVGVNSAMGRNTLIGNPPFNVITGPKVMRYQFSASHSSLKFGPVPDPLWFPSYFNNTPGAIDTSPTATYQCVRQLLGIPGGSCPFPSVELDAARPVTTSIVSKTPDITGHLSSGQSVSYTLPIDTESQSQFLVTWITGTMSLTLTNPLGTVIDPAYAAVHPTEVAYYENLDPSAQLFATYAFTSTIPGIYTLTVAAGDVGVQGTDYTLSSLVDSPRIMSVSTDKNLYSIGSTAILSASIKNAGTGLTGATVTAQVSRPGIITDSVTLLDRGGGIYTGTYSIPNIAGYLGITVIANGNDNGIAYARQLNSLLAISSPTVQLNGQYSDSPQDDDNNDLYESLNLGIGFTSTQAGNYLVSGDLIGASNEFIAHSVISVTLGTGTLTTTLPFNGDEIRSSGVDGAYTLTNLTIVDQQLAGVPAVWIMPNVWTTMPYDHTIFGTCKALTLITNPSDSGNIMTSPEPNCNNGTQFVTSTTITLTANAGSGYEFYNWTGGLNSVSNPISITLNSDLVITANFTVSLATITPTPSQTPSPTGTPTPSQTVTPSPSNTPTPTNSPTTTNTPTSTTTPSPSVTTTPTITQQSPSATPSLTPTVTSTPIIVGNKVYLPIIIR